MGINYIVMIKIVMNEVWQLFFIKLPFLENILKQIKKYITFFLRKINPNFKFILVKVTFNIGKYFTYKDKQSVLRRSNVVYKITCKCGDSYIGQTKETSNSE